ncbi:MAG: hypothetical protein L0Z49_05765 [Actinobacteria bacterium]|nr:hypothetical protein [Actinomycetota bacterium]
MRKRHIDLITALVEGLLEDDTEARALIDASPTLRAEYEAQVRARGALLEMEEASMRADERTALHRELWTALRAEVSPSPPPRAGLGWAYAAVGAVLLVGALSLIGDGLTRTAGTESGGELAPIAEDAAGAPATTMAAATVTEDTERLALIAMQARDGDLAYAAAEDELGSECLDQAGVSHLEPLGEISDEGERYALMVPDADAVGPDTPVVFVDLATCEVAHRDG